MLSSFLKITLRNLYREKMYALINISGLSIAIACCLILGLYLRSELTYDQHNIRHKRIFRVVNEFGEEGTFAITSLSLGPMLSEEYPEVQGYVRFLTIPQPVLVTYEDKAFYWEDHYIADDNVFDVFTHEIIYGDPKTALIDPKSIAVSETFARKYFGNANPVGETVNTINETLKITLVFADLPENSHMKYDVLTSFNMELLKEPDSVTVRRARLWMAFAFTYLVMPEGFSPLDFNTISDSFFERNMAEAAKARKDSWRCWLQPLADIHLNSKVGYDLPTGNKLYLYGLTAVAVFILLVACINHMNLATARATKRAKEVGMQKVLGAGQLRLMIRFLAESVFFSLVSLFLGLVLLEITLNLTPINELLNRSLAFNLRSEPELAFWMLACGLFIGFASGIYPALYLSSLAPLPSLMSGNYQGKGRVRTRQLLVLIQFTISIGVIACALLMGLQMGYISKKSLGYKKENRLIVPVRGTDLIAKLPVLKKELMIEGSILGISESSIAMGDQTAFNSAKIENKEGTMENASLRNMQVGDDFIEVMGMELVSGRDFSRKLLTDVGAAFIVNETMVKEWGWTEPIGKRIQMNLISGRVIGVVKDFHFASLHNKIEPFAMHRFNDSETTSGEVDPYRLRHLVFNISGKDIHKTLGFLQDKYSEFDPVHPFEFEFLDNALGKLYLSEQRLMKLTGIFAGVCIFISCMGLFGLAAFATEQRTKEIGIRKVLGATTWQVIFLLFRNILLLVLVGAALASLVAYSVMDEWLTGFAYRTDIKPWVFLLSALVAALVAFVTVALQSYKTAQANPVKALRYE